MIDPASFRDPSGFIVHEEDRILRIVNSIYEKDYSHLTNSGLSELLISKKLLISHQEISTDMIYSDSQYKVLEAEKIPFITYPYEWSFSQFKDAALLTLQLEEIAIEHQMMLKDATPYNIQFHNGKAIFIDTLSFEKTEQNYEWKAYKQFCEFFLLPLCLMIYKDPRLSILLKDFINGIPLDLGVKLIPSRHFIKPSLFLHLLLQNKIQNTKKQPITTKPGRIITKQQHSNLISYLKSFIQSMSLPKIKTEWDAYYDETKGEKPKYFKSKEKLVEEFVKKINPKTVWDIGANDGHFSRIASKFANHVISIDYDWRCIEYCYNEAKKNNIQNIVPVLSDLVNPSGGIGWNNEERKPLFSRSEKPNVIIALALMHHIINANVPFHKLLDILCNTTEFAIIEYIPATDPKVELIFKSRGRDWKYIDETEFKNTIEAKFEIIEKQILEGSNRVLYLLKVKSTK